MATALTVWSPIRELERFRRDFDELFERWFDGRWGFPATTSTLVPAIESFVEGDKLVVRADLPGVDPKDVEITVSGGNLIIRGKREQRREHASGDMIHREIRYGAFERSLPLPEGVKAEDIKATYNHGVLELAIPLPSSMVAHKVPIEVK